MSHRVITLADALDAGQRQFVATGGLDMRRLAEELAVSRATLYRVASRDHLLGEILWQLGGGTQRDAVRAAGAAGLVGVPRFLDISRRIDEAIAGFVPLHTFIRTEPVVAAGVLYTSAGRVLERFVTAWIAIFAEAERRGEFTPPFVVDELAYVYVRIGESLLFPDLLAGTAPDVNVATRIRHALLTAT